MYIDRIKDMVAAAIAKGNVINPSPELVASLEEMLKSIWSQAWLDNATTRELIDELSTRIGMNNCGRFGCDCMGLDYKPTGRICADAPH